MAQKSSAQPAPRLREMSEANTLRAKCEHIIYQKEENRMETDKRLVLRFENGQFTFRGIANTANDEELFGLAKGLNAFQDDPVKNIIKIKVIQF